MMNNLKEVNLWLVELKNGNNFDGLYILLISHITEQIININKLKTLVFLNFYLKS